jgi:hypothetical protein
VTDRRTPYAPPGITMSLVAAHRSWSFHEPPMRMNADFQPQEDVRVLSDPVGHPFCLYLDRGEFD